MPVQSMELQQKYPNNFKQMLTHLCYFCYVFFEIYISAKLIPTSFFNFT